VFGYDVSEQEAKLADLQKQLSENVTNKKIADLQKLQAAAQEISVR